MSKERKVFSEEFKLSVIRERRLSAQIWIEQPDDA